MCKYCEWEEEIQLANEMLNDLKYYRFGLKYIKAIKKWVEENKHITEKQDKVLYHIYKEGQKQKKRDIIYDF